MDEKKRKFIEFQKGRKGVCCPDCDIQLLPWIIENPYNETTELIAFCPICMYKEINIPYFIFEEDV